MISSTVVRQPFLSLPVSLISVCTFNRYVTLYFYLILSARKGGLSLQTFRFGLLK